LQSANQRTFKKLGEWLENSSREVKVTSAYLLEHQVEVNSQLFKSHYKNLIRSRAETLQNTTMLNGTLAAAWRIRHEILKLEIARLPEHYQELGWNLVKKIYFRSLGYRQLSDPIFDGVRKIASENSIFWENMQKIQENGSDLEDDYSSLMLAVSKANNQLNFRKSSSLNKDYLKFGKAMFPLEHPMEIQGQPPSRNRKKKKNHPNYGRKSTSCNQSGSYEHHFALMATFVDTNEHDNDEDDEKSPGYPTPYPMETPLPRESAFYISETERKLCEDNAKLQAFLRRIAESIED